MKRAILRGVALIIAAALVICTVASAWTYGGRQTVEKEAELVRVAAVIARQFDVNADNDAQAQSFALTLGSARVTIVAPDGTVTGDSVADFRAMENHGARDEIVAARITGSGADVRNSSTLGRRLMYAAVKTPEGYFIRLSEEYAGLGANVLALLPSAIPAALLSFLIAAYLANRFSRGVTRHMQSMNEKLSGIKDGGTPLDPEDYPYAELQDAATGINALARDVGLQIQRLGDERDKLAFIIDSMKEGFILLDANQTALLINDGARAFLGGGNRDTGERITHLTRDYAILRAVDRTFAEQTGHTADINVNGSVIETSFTFVPHLPGMDGAGVIITMTDVTERRNALKMRRDFFANASHELKTPITSIKGGAELLLSGVKLDDEQRAEMLTRIGVEADRMSTLINDIIMINRIESGVTAEEPANVDFADVVRECCAEARLLAEQNGVTLNANTEPSVLYAGRRNLYEMASNLIVNAVKYNKPGGAVDITLRSDANEVTLTVRNDGDPIPPEHHSRVFERFYRVDASRGKTVGGTGLGLAIVKHVADSLDGRIELVSNYEIGTRFTVRLPVR